MRWLLRLGRRRRHDFEIAPDEIFLDAQNRPDFDQDRLEGRLERPLARSSFILVASLLTILLLTLLAGSWSLQVRQGSAYAAESAHNSLETTTLFAERGIIQDRNGVSLVTNTGTSTEFATRIYKSPGFSSLLGYVSYPKKDSSGNYYDTVEKGVAGIEASFNTALAGQNGTLLVEKDALGRIQSQGSVVPAKNGATLTLSIDARVQRAFYDAIKTTADAIPFSGGAGILMDADTGEILALVSYPEYDSNVLSAGTPSSVIAGYNTDARHVYLNRPVQGLYTPGSVVKPLEASGALTDGVVTPATSINDTGSISVPNPYDPSRPNIFIDWKAIGWEDLRKAIAFSSDVYFYMVGGGYGPVKGLGIARLEYWYRTFGLTSETGIELPGEQVGFVPTPEWKQTMYGQKWNIGDTYHTAIGQYAMQVTPLEEARAIAAIANGGKLLTPTLLKGQPIRGTDLPISAANLQVVREGMRQGVTEGTSIGLSDLSYFVDIAGKTGTAQTGVHNEFHNAWAVGFFPYEHPKYVYTVVMERGPSSSVIGGVYVTHQFLTALRVAAPEYFK